MRKFLNWINGEATTPQSGKWIDSSDPYRNEVWAQIPASGIDDAMLAVQAARRAMTTGPWAKISATERGRIMHRIAALLLEHNNELAEIEVRDNGKLLKEMRGQVKYASDLWNYYAGLADKIEGSVMPIEKQDVLGLTFREPVGVVLAITAWNSPLTFFALKCAPALAAGCSVVVKPSEFSTASSLAFAALTKEAGVPDGVVNVVSGFGREIGPALIEHPDVAAVTFTGSDITGAQVYAAAARGMKRVAMELGGKSPNIIFEDADLNAAANGAVSGIFGAAGQMCTAGSRVLVQNSVKQAFLEKVIAATRQIKLGDPMDPDTNMGPLSNMPQYKKVLNYIEIAHRDGATLVLGGKPAEGPGITGGHFVEPTIFSGVQNGMRIAQEEVFGPILSVIGFDTEDEAVTIGNEVAYGLSAGVWTKDIGRMVRVSRALHVGNVWGNTYRSYSYMMPMGGMKRSGVGRECGMEAVDEFLETKSLMLATAASSAGSSFVPR